MYTTRTDIRKAFKEIGYSVSFKRNLFKTEICNIQFKTPEMLKPIVVSKSNCYSVDTIEKHKKAFDLANSYNGWVMVDTDQKIV